MNISIKFGNTFFHRMKITGIRVLIMVSFSFAGLFAGQKAVQAADKIPDVADIEGTGYTGMAVDNNVQYWFEEGILQGTEGRGKEIFDPDTNAWYWLDAVCGGAVTTSKDVYQESNGGKWVRYDEDGHMMKGWQRTTSGLYYFDLITGAMIKGAATVDNAECAFDDITGIAIDCGWYVIDGVEYWYEEGKRQGMEGRGKEIYDEASDAWYWLDSIDNGKKATGKDVYQESWAGQYADREDGTGKWVRYDENGRMIKGWHVQNGNTYYFDWITGAMAKGTTEINGVSYCFDMATGILQSLPEGPSMIGGNIALKDLEYEETKDGTIRITEYLGTESNIEFPSYINGKAVTELSLDAGTKYNDVISITVPDTVSKCCFNTFYNLEIVNFGKGMTDFTRSTFTYCKSIKEINVSSTVKNFDDGWCLMTNTFKGAVLNIYTSPDQVTLNGTARLEGRTDSQILWLFNQAEGAVSRDTNHFSQVNFIY